MKNLVHWLFAVALLFSGVCISRADGSYAMPQTNQDYMMAMVSYRAGLDQMGNNPQAAIKCLLAAQQHIQQAIADGAGYQVNQLSELIGRALIAVESKQKTSPVV